jgi:non-canonical (house-cleaning) NTP pyrophosphatase
MAQYLSLRGVRAVHGTTGYVTATFLDRGGMCAAALVVARWNRLQHAQ